MLGSWSELPALLADALQVHGYRLAYAPLSDGLAGWVRRQFHHTCDGAILVDTLPTDLRVLPSLGLPVVAVNELTDMDLVHVTPDQRQGIALAVAHLRDHGHRHDVACVVAGPHAGAETHPRDLGRSDLLHRVGQPAVGDVGGANQRHLCCCRP